MFLFSLVVSLMLSCDAWQTESASILQVTRTEGFNVVASTVASGGDVTSDAVPSIVGSEDFRDFDPKTINLTVIAAAEHSSNPYRRAFAALMQKGGLPTDGNLFDLVVRAYYGRKAIDNFDGMLLPSLELFWNQAELGDVILVFDAKDRGNKELESMIPGWKARVPSLKVIYESEDIYPEMPGWDGYLTQMYSCFVSDRYSAAPLIGMVDTDTMFIEPPLPLSLLDENGRPRQVVWTGERGLAWWDKDQPDGTEMLLGKKQEGGFAMNWPVMLRRETFENIRQKISQVAGGISFNQAIAKHLTAPGNSHRFGEFSIMGTYAMHFERDLYGWSFFRHPSGHNLFPVPDDPLSLQPLPRVAIHARYAHTTPRDHLVAGYCAVRELDGAGQAPAICQNGEMSRAHWHDHIWFFDNMGPWPDNGTDSRQKVAELHQQRLQEFQWSFNKSAIQKVSEFPVQFPSLEDQPHITFSLGPCEALKCHTVELGLATSRPITEGDFETRRLTSDIGFQTLYGQHWTAFPSGHNHSQDCVWPVRLGDVLTSVVVHRPSLDRLDLLITSRHPDGSTSERQVGCSRDDWAL